MYSAAFIFEPGTYDDRFHALDALIEQAARETPGMSESACSPPITAACRHVIAVTAVVVGVGRFANQRSSTMNNIPPTISEMATVSG